VWVTLDGSSNLPRAAAPAAEAPEAVAQVLKRYRKAHGLSQARLAERLVVDQTAVSRVERGVRSVHDIRELRRWAVILDLPPESLGVAATLSDSREQFDPAHALSRLREARDRRALGDPMGAYWIAAWVATPLRDWAAAHDGAEATMLCAELAIARALTLADLVPEEELPRVLGALDDALGLLRADASMDATALFIVLAIGNALRRAGNVSLAVGLLKRAISRSHDPWFRVSSGSILAKAYSTLREHDEFVRIACVSFEVPSRTPWPGPLPSTHTLLKRSRPETPCAAMNLVRAWKLLDKRAAVAGDLLASPQHRIIRAITRAEACAMTGEIGESVESLVHAANAAAQVRLPHQLQRIVRVSEQGLRQSELFLEPKELAASLLNS